MDFDVERSMITQRVNATRVYEISGFNSEFGASIEEHSISSVTFYQNDQTHVAFSVYAGKRSFTNENYFTTVREFNRLFKEDEHKYFWTTNRTLAEAICNDFNKEK